MRITKTIAHDVAEKALSFRNEEIEKAEDAFTAYIDELGDKFTPSEIKEMAIKYPGYFNRTTGFYIWVKGGSSPWKTYHGSKAIPTQGGRNDTLYVDDESLKKLEKSELRVKRLKDTLTKDFEALEIALVQLGTAKRVKAELPELEKYLPCEITTSLVPNMDHIRKIILV